MSREKLVENIDGILQYVMDGYYASDGGLEHTRDEILKAVLDEVVGLSLIPPDYISSSHSHMRGYSKALDDMMIKVNKLRVNDE